MHDAPWNEKSIISPFFELLKYKADILYYTLQPSHFFDIVYFDAFGPNKQPDLWCKKIFKKIIDQCNPGAILVTYSAKGEVRRQLQQVGFTMERLPGPPGKRQMLRGHLSS
jgi:tRNA U34 5-methylaminomethyl-2-thiouridine-forming methyltransferase MnmC